jgi:hypothetical protein
MNFSEVKEVMKSIIDHPIVAGKYETKKVKVETVFFFFCVCALL